jgi:hypothetical protein
MLRAELALRLAASRHAVLTLRRAQRHGLDRRDMRRLVEGGLFACEARGVYRALGAPRTYEQQVALAVAAAGGQAWAAGPCAARLWRNGIPWFDRAEPEIVVVYGRTSLDDARRFAAVRRTRNLDPPDHTVSAGLPITSRLRTIVDCMGRVPEPALFALADDVLWRWYHRDLRATFARTRRTAEAELLDRILAPWELAGPPPESPKEISLVRVLFDAGLPLPERQVPIVDPCTGRVVARADHGYADARVAVEYLGRRDHGIRQAHGDVLRDEDLRAMGWVAAYARREHLVPPGSATYAAAVRHLLRARRAPAAPPPPPR